MTQRCRIIDPGGLCGHYKVGFIVNFVTILTGGGVCILRGMVWFGGCRWSVRGVLIFRDQIRDNNDAIPFVDGHNQFHAARHEPRRARFILRPRSLVDVAIHFTWSLFFFDDVDPDNDCDALAKYSRCQPTL